MQEGHVKTPWRELCATYTVIHIDNLLAHYVSHYIYIYIYIYIYTYIQKLKRLHKQRIVPLKQFVLIM